MPKCLSNAVVDGIDTEGVVHQKHYRAFPKLLEMGDLLPLDSALRLNFAC